MPPHGRRRMMPPHSVLPRCQPTVARTSREGTRSASAPQANIVDCTRSHDAAPPGASSGGRPFSLQATGVVELPGDAISWEQGSARQQRGMRLQCNCSAPRQQANNPDAHRSGVTREKDCQGNDRPAGTGLLDHPNETVWIAVQEYPGRRALFPYQGQRGRQARFAEGAVNPGRGWCGTSHVPSGRSLSTR